MRVRAATCCGRRGSGVESDLLSLARTERKSLLISLFMMYGIVVG
jgi:hypothetical protein